MCEKMVEILKLWIQEVLALDLKVMTIISKNIDGYTLVGESKNWSDDVIIVLQVVRPTIDVSNRRISSENIHSIVNSL